MTNGYRTRTMSHQIDFSILVFVTVDYELIQKVSTRKLLQSFLSTIVTPHIGSFHFHAIPNPCANFRDVEFPEYFFNESRIKGMIPFIQKSLNYPIRYFCSVKYKCSDIYNPT